MSSSNIDLPPVRHLPHWTRVGGLGKACCAPRCAPGSQTLLQPLRTLPSADTGRQMRAQAPEESRHSDPEPRVASLQRNLQFLQQQHQDTLGKLHKEIEHLRRENKELQYKLIMESPTVSRKGLPTSRRGLRPPTQGSDARTGLYLQDTRPLHDQAASLTESTDAAGSLGKAHGPELKGGLITSLQPLRIHSSPAHPPRPPTLHECEVIIRQLYNANSIQSQELLRVKALLRDIVFSKKITPENYILTKTYLADGTRKFSETEKLPKLGLQTFPEKSSEAPQLPLILPALKQSFSTSIADRQRRTRAVQRSRFKRVVQ